MARFWSFPPSTDILEVLEHQTDILSAEASEQRICLREQPRALLTIRHRLDGFGLAGLAELVRRGYTGTWRVPMWHLSVQPEFPVSQTDTVVSAPTDFSDFLGDSTDPDGLFVAISVDGKPAALVPLQASSPGELIFPEALGAVLPRETCAPGTVQIAPVRRGIMIAPVSVERERQDRARVSASFIVQDGRTWEWIPDLVYRRRPVLTQPSIVREPLSLSLQQPVEIVDNGLGFPALEVLRSVFDRSETVRWKAQGRFFQARLRGFLCSVRGRQRAFWLPTWGWDLRLTQGAGEGSSALYVRPVAEVADYAGRAILIESEFGFFATRIEFALSSGQSHFLSLEDALPYALPVEARIHFLTLMRSDADRFELRHVPNACEVTFLCRELAEAAELSGGGGWDGGGGVIG